MRPARAVLARRTIGRGLVARVAAATVAAAQEYLALADLDQIKQQGALLVIGEHLGADRHLDHQILAAGAGAVRACPAVAALGPEMLGVAKVDQRVQAGHCFEDDVAALAAVTAVRAAIFDELFTSETDRPGATGAGANEDLCLIEEMHASRLACRRQ